MNQHDPRQQRDDRWVVRVATLDELDARTAYQAWALRQDVFVVEQDCAYRDLDGRDLEPGTRHVVLLDDGDGGRRVVGVARVLDDGDVQRIGRVACHPDARGTGASAALMQAALDAATTAAPRADVVLGAQSPLTRWYGTFGFVPDGPEYLEDDIPHTPMRLHRR
ncbi:GNAT family N-acetyltransferase [Isoptericola sp. NEAU-Y5]|uniref:GNAT family N-acetyltransferase n=1 Tax=Isoptericola luteus TaxID=2879484 RepID=A0ABS7ZG51_9MICO|nr:GNAT family N-acetyltransferase [Isoptericola sp. NEAU-Y5]MCA5892569.1 GNAT family N-acetyltransferase [Isoptericola sp. NEAU-Y5]